MMRTSKINNNIIEPAKINTNQTALIKSHEQFIHIQISSKTQPQLNSEYKSTLKSKTNHDQS